MMIAMGTYQAVPLSEAFVAGRRKTYRIVIAICTVILVLALYFLAFPLLRGLIHGAILLEEHALIGVIVLAGLLLVIFITALRSLPAMREASFHRQVVISAVNLAVYAPLQRDFVVPIEDLLTFAVRQNDIVLRLKKPPHRLNLPVLLEGTEPVRQDLLSAGIPEISAKQIAARLPARKKFGFILVAILVGLIGANIFYSSFAKNPLAEGYSRIALLAATFSVLIWTQNTSPYRPEASRFRRTYRWILLLVLLVILGIDLIKVRKPMHSPAPPAPPHVIWVK